MADDDSEHRTCQADCTSPATRRVENRGGEVLFTCEPCAEQYGGSGVTVTELPDGRRYVYTAEGQQERGTEVARDE